MDFQSAVPAFLLLGSAVVTVIMRMRGSSGDLTGTNRWVIGFSLAIISAVSTFIISQTGNPGAIVSEDQYMLAMLVTTVFLLIYYVCTGGAGSDPNAGVCDPAAVGPPASTATCCGGDIRNQMINTDCPPYIPPPEPYPPCIDNVFNENCYSKPFIPDRALPCINADERRVKIRWDRKIDCPKHKQMVLKGDYPWAPGTPNWQNRSYVDENANLWYGPDPGVAPTRDQNRNIQGRLLPPQNQRGNRLSAIPGEVGGGSAGAVPFMGGNVPGQNTASPIRLQRKKKPQQEFFWGQPPPKPTRFRAPDISYVPQAYTPPDMTQADGLVALPDAAFGQGNAPGSFCLAQLPSENGRGVSATNWRIMMTCALVLLFHRCYRNVVHLARSQGGRGSRGADPFQLISQNPGVVGEAIKQDATMMVILLSVACVIMFITMSGKRSGQETPANVPSAVRYPAVSTRY